MRRQAMVFLVVGMAVGALAVGALTEGKAPRRLNLASRTDDRPFSHVVVSGSTIYVAGTLGLDPATGQPPADPAAEVRLAMDGVRSKLELAGATVDDLVSVQIFCSDISLYGEFKEIYRTYFDKGYPARAFVGSGPLLRDARFEISAIATR